MCSCHILSKKIKHVKMDQLVFGCELTNMMQQNRLLMQIQSFGGYIIKVYSIKIMHRPN